MVLDTISIEMPGDVMGDFMHDRCHIAAAVAHMLAALHADLIEGWRTPGVGSVFMLCYGRTRHGVVITNHGDKRSALG